MKKDIIEVKILEDGQIMFTTEAISEANHASADEFFEEVFEAMGSERVTRKIDHPFWKNREVQRGGKVVKTNQ